MRMKKTINDKNRTEIKKKKYIYIYISFTFVKHTETKLSYTFWNEHLHSSVPPSQIGSKPNNILFLILSDRLFVAPFIESLLKKNSSVFPFFYPFHVQLHCFLKTIVKDKNSEEKAVYFRIARLVLWNINWIHHSAE